MASQPRRTLFYIGGSKKALGDLPSEVRDEFIGQLEAVLCGVTPGNAKPLSSLVKGEKIFELVEDHDKETYRAFYYLVRDEKVYLLDAIHKKSKSGKALPKEDIKRLVARVKQIRKENSRGGGHG